MEICKFAALSLRFSITTMTNNQKTAIVRIVSDLIKADNILDFSEMKFLEMIRGKYNIDDTHLVAAQKIDFGLAVKYVSELPENEIADLLAEMRILTRADGNCCPAEALLIMALDYCLDSERNTYCKLITTNVTSISISKCNIVYTESQYDEETNEKIRENFRTIMDLFTVAGLNFVYIPQITKDFNSMQEDYLHNTIHFLAPSLAEEKKEEIFTTLRTINTKDFCHDFLVKKIGLEPLYDADPALLLQVSKSHDKITYLQISLGEDILADMRDFVDSYKVLTVFNPNLIHHNKESSRFLYYGFHKAMFDLMAFPGTNVESRILIDLLKRKVTFMDLREDLKLPKMQLALYIFIIQQSLCSKTHELPIEVLSEVRKAALDKTFNRIYGMMDGEKGTDYTKNLTPNISHIRQALKTFVQLDNLASYLPEKTEDKTLRVKIKPSKVFVVHEGTIMPMAECLKWQEL